MAIWYGPRYPEGQKTWNPATADGLTDAMQMAFEKYYKPEIDWSSYSEFIAVVEDIRKGPLDSNSSAAYEAVNSNTIKNKTYIILANVKVFDFLPSTTEYSDGRSTDNDIINMKQSLKMEFECANTAEREPHMGEHVRVNWKKRTGVPLFDWEGGQYLGPVNTCDPIIEPPATEQDIARYSFHKPTQKDGLNTAAVDSNHNSMIGSPGRERKAFNEEPSPRIQNVEKHWDKPTYATKKNEVPKSKIYDKKEIYVAKKLDYPNLENINMIPYSERTQIIEQSIDANPLYRKDDKAYLLPEEENIYQRANTKMIIINETGDYHSAVYKKIRKNPLMHFGIAMNSGDPTPYPTERECTIRVNIPYGLSIGRNNAFSENCVGCMISSPFDGSGKNFLNLVDYFQGPITSERVSIIRSGIEGWVNDKTIPGGFEAFIMGPFGTPGLKTGPHKNSNDFFQGRLMWTKTGHYILPNMFQAYVLYELINSLIHDPPLSSYSWGFTKPRRVNHQLSWSFPAVGGGGATFPYSNFISKKPLGNFEATSGFPWGVVGEGKHRKRSKFYKYWENQLEQYSNITGIVSNSRWHRSSGGTFLEYYLLARSLNAGHREGWYIALGAASETYPKQYGGVGLGPSPLPLASERNRLLQKGQQMWAEATSYIRKDVTNRGVLYTKSLARTTGKNEPTISKQKKQRQREMRRGR